MALEQAARKDAFEGSFARRETPEVNGAIVEVVDVAPIRPTDKTDVLLAGAWACTIPVYKPAMRELSKEGRRVVSLNYPRHGGDINLAPEERELLKDFPEEQVRKAITLIGVLEYKKMDAVDILAHSEGTGAAAIATFLLIKRAEKTGQSIPVHNLMLCGPAGLIGKDNILRLGYGFAMQDSGVGPRAHSLKAGSEWGDDTLKQRLVLGHRESVTDAERARAAAEGREVPKYEALEATEGTRESMAAAQAEMPKYVKENIGRSLKEVWGISQVQIEDLFRPIKAHGIGIVVMTGVDDPVFPTKRITKTISGLKGPSEKTKDREKDIDSLAENIVDGVLTVRGGHGDPFDSRFVAASEAVLSQLDAKYKERKGRLTADTSDG